MFREILKLQSTSLPSAFGCLLDQQSKKILYSVAEYTRSAHLELSQDLAKAMSQLASRLNNPYLDEYYCRRRAIPKEMQHASGNRATSGIDLEIISEIELLSVSPEDEAHVRSAVRNKILGSLRCQSLSSRFDSITNAHPETFEPRRNEVFIFREERHRPLDHEW